MPYLHQMGTVNHRQRHFSRQCCRILFLCLLVAIPAFAQTQWAFSGYWVNLPIYQTANDLTLFRSDAAFLDLNRLRLRPTLYVGQNGRLALEYEATVLYQSAGLFFSPSTAQTGRQVVEARWTPLNEAHWQITHFIDRLYWRQDFSFGNLVIGRQRVAWGTGRIWNPTDLFNPINPAAFDKIEKDGADLLTAQVYAGNFTDLTLVVNPRKRLRDTNAGFRFRSNYRSYDLALVGGYFDRRMVIGGDFAGNLLHAGFRGEAIGAFDPDGTGDFFSKWILGLDYQFTSRLYGLLEYQHNGQGRRDRQRYDLPALIEGRIINLAQNYLFGQAQVQLHALVNGGLGWNGNLDDGSGFFSLNLSYAYRSNIDVQMGGLIFYGDMLDEYWYYTPTAFLRGTIYF